MENKILDIENCGCVCVMCRITPTKPHSKCLDFLPAKCYMVDACMCVCVCVWCAIITTLSNI